MSVLKLKTNMDCGSQSATLIQLSCSFHGPNFAPWLCHCCQVLCNILYISYLVRWLRFECDKSWLIVSAIAWTIDNCVILIASLYICKLCPMLPLGLYPSVICFTSPCTCCREVRITWSCASHTCLTWSAKSLRLAFFHSKFLSIKLQSVWA